MLRCQEHRGAGAQHAYCMSQINEAQRIYYSCHPITMCVSCRSLGVLVIACSFYTDVYDFVHAFLGHLLYVRIGTIVFLVLLFERELTQQAKEQPKTTSTSIQRGAPLTLAANCYCSIPKTQHDV